MNIQTAQRIAFAFLHQEDRYQYFLELVHGFWKFYAYHPLNLGYRGLSANIKTTFLYNTLQ